MTRDPRTPRIGDQPAFPYGPDEQPGMTYRQWLVGMVLQGRSSHVAFERDGESILHCVDKVLAAMENE